MARAQGGLRFRAEPTRHRQTKIRFKQLDRIDGAIGEHTVEPAVITAILPQHDLRRKDGIIFNGLRRIVRLRSDGVSKLKRRR